MEESNAQHCPGSALDFVPPLNQTSRPRDRISETSVANFLLQVRASAETRFFSSGYNVHCWERIQLSPCVAYNLHLVPAAVDRAECVLHL